MRCHRSPFPPWMMRYVRVRRSNLNWKHWQAQAPSIFVVNGYPYSDIGAGEPFTVSVSESLFSPTRPHRQAATVTDNLPIEVGVKFFRLMAMSQVCAFTKAH